MDVLLKRVHEEVMSNPPLGYEPQEAATRFFDKAKSEVAASRREVRKRSCSELALAHHAPVNVYLFFVACLHLHLKNGNQIAVLVHHKSGGAHWFIYAGFV